MPDFKLYGSTDPVVTQIGQMHMGIGIEPIPVEGTQAQAPQPQTQTFARILSASSLHDQVPNETDTPQLITFGDAKSNQALQLKTTGEVIFLKDMRISLRMTAMVSRDDNPGVARMLVRMRVGNLVYRTKLIELENKRAAGIVTIQEEMIALESSSMYFEMYRDSGGRNSGGLYKHESALWGTIPSALLVINQLG